MVILFIQDYTRASGKVVKSGSLSEVDQETGQGLIDSGIATYYAASASNVGCQDMLAKNHLLGMNQNQKIYIPDDEDED